jgi:hypothetical protein
MPGINIGFHLPNSFYTGGLNAEEQSEALEEAKKPFRKASLIAVISLCFSVALAIIGIAFAVSGTPAASIPFLLVSLPAGYLSYNIHKVSDNALDVLDKWTEYRTQMANQRVWDARAIKEVKAQLKQGTFCFGYAIDYIVSRAGEEASAATRTQRGTTTESPNHGSPQSIGETLESVIGHLSSIIS